MTLFDNFIDEGMHMRTKLIGVGVEELERRCLLSGWLPEWGTLLGGGEYDAVRAMVIAPDGAIYLAGMTTSPDWPATPGAFDTSFAGTEDWGDAFVAKLAGDGRRLEWATFLGGSGDDEAMDIALDGEGNVVIVGSTASPDFPTTAGAWQAGFQNSHDAFVAKLAADGSRLIFSTYLGGTINRERARAVALDGIGNIYVAGYATSPDFPTTADSFDPTFNGGTEGFVAKLSADGSALLAATFLGAGPYPDWINDLALGPDGQVYVTGTTWSDNFPVTPGAFQAVRVPGFHYDGFVTSFDASLSRLGFSTYLGSSAGDEGYAIAVDATGVYVQGYAGAVDFPTTEGAFDTTLEGVSDVFLLKLDPAGSRLLYSTFLGGGGWEEPHAMALNTQGEAYVAGITTSGNFPVTADVFDTSFEGGTEAFLLKMSATGDEMLEGTFLGGAGFETIFGMDIGEAGQVVVGGHTNSNPFPTTPGAFDTTWNGAYDGFVWQFREEASLPVAESPPLTIITHGYQVNGRYPTWVADLTAAIVDRTGALVYAPDWAAVSNNAGPGWAEAEGDRLFAEIVVQALRSVEPLDLHLIGHSRGAVVNSEAAERLAYYQASWPALDGAIDELHVTMLDPHPAHNHKPDLFSTSDPFVRAFTRSFQRNANDPEVGFWSSTNWADVYYQQTAIEDCTRLGEGIINLWGEAPFEGAYNHPSLTGMACHRDVHDWYQATVADPARQEGYYWSLAGGGWDNRPVPEASGKQAPGPFVLGEVFNGDFHLTGKEYGGDVSYLPGFSGAGYRVRRELAELLARPDRPASLTHNALVIPPGFDGLTMDLRRLTRKVSGNVQLEIFFVPQLGVGPGNVGEPVLVTVIPLADLPRGIWLRDYSVSLAGSLDTSSGLVGSFTWRITTDLFGARLEVDNISLQMDLIASKVSSRSVVSIVLVGQALRVSCGIVKLDEMRRIDRLQVGKRNENYHVVDSHDQSQDQPQPDQEPRPKAARRARLTDLLLDRFEGLFLAGLK